MAASGIPPVIPPEDLLRDLMGTTCSACGAAKQVRQSFCKRCYRSLPHPMRQALYRRMGAGYEEAFAAAFDRLTGVRSTNDPTTGESA
jgi:predicted amidophosphoribosyltransferase